MIKKIIDSSKNIYTSVAEHTFNGDEKRFENICKRELHHFLSDKDDVVEIFNFEYTFVSDWDNAKPDLFAISKDYKYFAIIEVETSNHPLDRHVIPQMKSLTTSHISYLSEQIFNYLKKHNKKFSAYKLKEFQEMMNAVEPEFIVVTEKYIEEWELRLAFLDVRYMSLSVYKNDIDEDCYSFQSLPAKINKEIININWTHNYYLVDINNDVTYFKNNDIIKVKLGQDDDSINLSIYRKQGKVMLFPFGKCHFGIEDLSKYKRLRPRGDVFELLEDE